MEAKNADGYPIGAQTWSFGDEITITSAPYLIHGGLFQDAVTEHGKKIVVKADAFAWACAGSKMAADRS